MSRRNVDRTRSVDYVSTLKVDKDCFVDPTWIRDYVHSVIIPACASFGVTVMSVQMCDSKKKGNHFYIKIEPAVKAALANELQWLIGDDCRRVDYNRARIESQLNEWNKLFEVPGNHLKIIYRAFKMDYDHSAPTRIECKPG